ncbi:MAG TPA: response regulator, partial [Burkholderiaceae bacterium]|nr:response regulator [Burkholderiaceae bacterium]
KPAGGTIVLSFSRQGQQVVMRCQDDGRGLDYPAIRARAIDRGLISPTQVVSDEELARLILMSGFSTRHTINELSGRGVGLDVVREWASSTSGSIRVSSRPAEGCTLELRFPASLSTMQSLIVEAGQRFALPSVQVERAVSRGVGSFERLGDKLVYRLDRFVHPAMMLTELAGIPVAGIPVAGTPVAGLPAGDGPTNELSNFDAVLVRIDDRVHVLAVEGLVDSRELLVKNPGRYARHVRGVAGLSILGDGSVAVNLDLSQLFAGGGPAARGASRTAAFRGAAAQDSETSGDSGEESGQGRARSPLAVLIVDDALSVRNSLQQLMQDAGFRAETARDGIEAISALTGFRPDAVLTDLEMPNMNGLELTAHIRGREDLKDLPVIMITSRSQDKHRRMAEKAGVDSYITKPYNDVELLEAIRASLAARGCVRS